MYAQTIFTLKLENGKAANWSGWSIEIQCYTRSPISAKETNWLVDVYENYRTSIITIDYYSACSYQISTEIIGTTSNGKGS